MKHIPLTQGKVAIVDDADAGLAKFNWSATRDHAGRWHVIRNAVTPDGKHFVLSMARQIMGLGYGDKSKLKVTHLNHDGLDLRRENLRVIAVHQIRSKLRSDSVSQYKGVGWHQARGKYRVRIWSAGNKAFFLGYFSDPEAGARAYDDAAVELFGPELAVTNASLGLLTPDDKKGKAA